MFFGQPEAIDLKKYTIQQWVSVSQFYEKLQEEGSLLLRGHGFFSYEVTGQFTEFLGCHLLQVNDRLFGFFGESRGDDKADENSSLSFKNITEFNSNILTSQIFQTSQYSSSKNSYSKFDADLDIEAKLYLYEDEEKLLLSKKGQGNIDLYCCYQVKNNTNELFCKVYPTAFTASKHLAMSKILDQRIKELKK